MFNSSRFQISQHPKFLQSDSVLVASPENAGGFGIAGVLNYRLSKHIELRALFPQFQFAYKNISYNLKYPDPVKEEHTQMIKRVESILVGPSGSRKVPFRQDR